MNKQKRSSTAVFTKKALIYSTILVLALVAGVVIYSRLLGSELPEPLVYAVVPAEDAGLVRERFTPFIDYLSLQLDRPVKLMVTVDYAAVVEALKYGHADLARLGPFSYILATEEAEIEAFAAGVTERHGEPSYQALIIALASKNIEDLNGKTLAYVDVGSTSGYLAPSTYVMESGIELGGEFFAGTHNAVLAAVQNGTVDAGCTADIIFFAAVKEGVISTGDFDIVWESKPLPGSPIVFQKSMDRSLQDAIRSAFLEAPEEIIWHIGIGEIEYVPVLDSDYDVTRRILALHEQLR